MKHNRKFAQNCRRFTLAVIWVFSSTCIVGSETRVLRIGSPGDPQTLDPHRYTLNLEEHILKDMFLGLTAMDAKGSIVPGSAKSWQTSSDGLTWTFHLRENYWSDGTPVRAEDFVFSLRRLLAPETAAPLAFFLYVLENARDVNSGVKQPSELGVSAPDDATLVMQLEKPFPYLPERLFYPTGFPLPAHVVKEYGRDWVKPENWVSNGAYQLADWKPQQAVALTKNPHFFDHEHVAIDRVEYVPVADSLASFHRYLADELDIIGDFPAGELESLRKSHAEHVHLSPLLSTMYLVFNVSTSQFTDARVREALALAIDRQKLTQHILRSGEIPNASIVPPIVEGYSSLIETEGANLEQSRALLKEAGFGKENPLKLTLRYVTGAENKRVYVAIAAMWQELGVDVTLHHAELKVHFSDLGAGEFEVAQAGWFGEGNPEHYIELLWSKIGGINYGRYESADFDRLLEEAKNTVDSIERASILQQAEALALRDFPVVPLYSVTIRSLVNPRISGWYPNPRNSHAVRYMSLN